LYHDNRFQFWSDIPCFVVWDIQFLAIWRLWTLISPIVYQPVAYFSSASIRTYLAIYRAPKFKSLLYGIFPIGQPDKNIGNLWKWSIYIISVCLLIVVSRACCVVFLICLSSSCVLCTQCCQFLWYAHCWFPLRVSLTFILNV
jgi:hypothetical protein